MNSLVSAVETILARGYQAATGEFVLASGDVTTLRLLVAQTVTLEQEHDRVMRDRWDITTCNACERTAKVYSRSFNRGMAVALVRMAALGGRERQWVHAQQDVGARGGDYAKMRWWGFIKPMPRDATPPRGTRTVGWWRITDDGYRALYLRHTFRLKWIEYDGIPLGPDTGSPVITLDMVRDFDYENTMKAAPEYMRPNWVERRALMMRLPGL